MPPLDFTIWQNEFQRLIDHLYAADVAEATDPLGRRPFSGELARDGAQRRSDAMSSMAQRSAAYDGEVGPSRFVVTLHGDGDLVAQLLDVLFEALNITTTTSTSTTPSTASSSALTRCTRPTTAPWSPPTRSSWPCSPAPSAATCTTQTASQSGTAANAASSPPAQADAFRARFRRCCHPFGCDRTGGRLQANHTPEWEDGGLTDIDHADSRAAPTTAGAQHRSHPPDGPMTTTNEEPRPERGPDHLSRFRPPAPAQPYRPAPCSLGPDGRRGPANGQVVASTGRRRGRRWPGDDAIGHGHQEAAIGWGSIQSGSRLPCSLGQLLGEPAAELRPQGQDPLVSAGRRGAWTRASRSAGASSQVLVEGRRMRLCRRSASRWRDRRTPSGQPALGPATPAAAAGPRRPAAYLRPESRYVIARQVDVGRHGDVPDVVRPAPTADAAAGWRLKPLPHLIIRLYRRATVTARRLTGSASRRLTYFAVAVRRWSGSAPSRDRVRHRPQRPGLRRAGSRRHRGAARIRGRASLIPLRCP